MKKLLFINSCPRGEGESRTLMLCEVFIKKYLELHRDVEVQKCSIYEDDIKPLGANELIERDKLIDEGKFENPMFKWARDFAAADKIIIGAPFWDLSFPSILKVYIENVCVRNLTFHNTSKGTEGMCKADKLMYISTVGGFTEGVHYGNQYIEGISKFWGIKSCSFLSAEGLDIYEVDTDEVMKNALREAEKAAESF